MAELDHDDRAEVTDTQTPETTSARPPAGSARTPVRSAPLGRRRRSKSPAGEIPVAENAGDETADEEQTSSAPAVQSSSAPDAAVGGAPDADDPAVVPVAQAADATTDTADAADGADTADSADTAESADTADTVVGGTVPRDTAAATDERDPSDVEKTLSYRDRRRARVASAAAGVAGNAGTVADAPAPSTVRYAGRKGASAGWLVAGVIGVVVIIACVAASIAFAIGVSRYDRENDLRAEYSAFASQMIVNLTTLNPGNVDQAMKTMETKTSGRAQKQMQDSMRQAVGLVQDQKVDTKSTIISNAVTKADPDEGTVILVSGWQMKSPDPKQDTIVQTFRWRVQLTRINGELKMTNFEWVT